MPTGRPFKPGNKFGRGRPPGSKNKRSVHLELLDQYGEPLLKKAISEAFKGDIPLLRTFLSYLLPRFKDAPGKPGRLAARTADDVRASMDEILRKVSTEEISLQEARAYAGIIATRQAVLQQTQYEGRLDALEEMLEEDLAASAKEPGKPGEEG